MRRHRQQENPSLLIALIIFMLACLAVVVAAAVILWPHISDFLTHTPPPAPPVQQALSRDAEFYFRLKNTSCRTLSHDFLIVTDDRATGAVSGIDEPLESSVAQSFASRYDFNQTTKTYVRGDQMKKVIVDGNRTHTTIWKDGRIYQCNPTCSMRLLGDDGWQHYLDTLASMREGCAHFGRTALPPSVNTSRLLRFEHTGQNALSGSRCEGFLVYGEKEYAESLLLNASLSEDQRTLLWGISHFAGPVEECLDDGSGVVIFRNLTLDLTGIYNFDYGPDGRMLVSQQTWLTYYDDEVPESFLALPQAD